MNGIVTQYEPHSLTHGNMEALPITAQPGLSVHIILSCQSMYEHGQFKLQHGACRLAGGAELQRKSEDRGSCVRL